MQVCNILCLIIVYIRGERRLITMHNVNFSEVKYKNSCTCYYKKTNFVTQPAKCCQRWSPQLIDWRCGNVDRGQGCCIPQDNDRILSSGRMAVVKTRRTCSSTNITWSPVHLPSNCWPMAKPAYFIEHRANPRSS
jgi:hypothetical protein